MCFAQRCWVIRRRLSSSSQLSHLYSRSDLPDFHAKYSTLCCKGPSILGGDLRWNPRPDFFVTRLCPAAAPCPARRTVAPSLLGRCAMSRSRAQPQCVHTPIPAQLHRAAHRRAWLSWHGLPIVAERCRAILAGSRPLPLPSYLFPHTLGGASNAPHRPPSRLTGAAVAGG